MGMCVNDIKNPTGLAMIPRGNRDHYFGILRVDGSSKHQSFLRFILGELSIGGRCRQRTNESATLPASLSIKIVTQVRNSLRSCASTLHCFEFSKPVGRPNSLIIHVFSIKWGDNGFGKFKEKRGKTRSLFSFFKNENKFSKKICPDFLTKKLDSFAPARL